MKTSIFLAYRLLLNKIYCLIVDPFLFLLCDLPIFSAIGNGTISNAATWLEHMTKHQHIWKWFYQTRLFFCHMQCKCPKVCTCSASIFWVSHFAPHIILWFTLPKKQGQPPPFHQFCNKNNNLNRLYLTNEVRICKADGKYCLFWSELVYKHLGSYDCHLQI